ncbi:hypothetical protein ENINCK360B_21755 [Enterobacter intestinihominis]|uniref:hypothetical protein n=1 Tax=Enterobacter hormaechei TaxID=158836 RepID=UPI000667BFB2|nr:hypothetical protein [Enterobacter hormaechei]
MSWKKGKSPKDVSKFINKNSPAIGKQFKKELSDRMRNVTRQIQTKINIESQGGVVPFTQKAMFFNFRKINEFQSVNQIIVLPNQAAYLKHIIDPAYKTNREGKIVPYKNAKLTTQGNITQLRSRSKSNKYKKVKDRKNGKTYLIDTTRKSSKGNPKDARQKRVIGYYGRVGRKPLFDFYDETEKKVIEQLRTLRGTFEYRWRK